MTDDSNARYRSNDPFARTPGPDGQGGDPLAELARLIGQSDQFAEIRDARPATPREPQHYDDPAPQSDLPYGDHDADRARYDAHGDHARDQSSYDSRYDAPHSTDPAPHDPALASEWHSPPAPHFDPFAPAVHQAPADAEPASHDYREAPSPQPRAFPSDFSFPSASSAPPLRQSGYDAPAADPAPRHGQDLPPPMRLSSERHPLPPPTDDFYDDAPQGGRRTGLITVAAVLCLAVVGTAGAFGYRTWFGGASVKSPPPVIRASNEPSKVAPPPSADPNANKISYDRFGDRGQNEKVVVREEKPVDLKDATRSGPAPAVTPGVSAAAAPTVASATPNPPSVLTEPKRVRTVPIRPDMPDASAARPPMTAPAPARQTTVAAVAPSNVPLDLANPASPPAQVRASAARVAVPSAPAPTANVPLSLAPDANPPPAAAAPVRSAPARVASAPAGNGSYLVQVSSQRSEADAQTAFRNIRSKYSNVLGDRQPVIRRAELAGKGTYYRAMVGPFTTRDQAIQLCSSLKAAGGDCVVQSN